MTPGARHRPIVRKFGRSHSAPPNPTTTPGIRRRSVQTLARNTPLDDRTPQESGAHEGSRESRSPRAPRARAFDLVRARMRHRFTYAKAPHGEGAERLAGAPPTTAAVPAACLMSHRETPHPTSLALTTPKYPRAQTRNHPRRPEPNMDDAQTPTPNDRNKPPVTRDRHRTRPHRPIGVLPRAMTHRPQRHPEPVVQKHQNCHPARFWKQRNRRLYAFIHLKFARNTCRWTTARYILVSASATRNRRSNCYPSKSPCLTQQIIQSKS